MGDSAAGRADVSGHESSASDPLRREALAPYTQPRLRRTLLELATSLLPFVVGWVLMYQSLGVSYWLTLALALPTAGFLLRTFILFHDCAHSSLFASRRANNWAGFALGLLVFQPFQDWRHHHAVHHGSAGDLDRRGTGDVLTLTVAEYEARSWRGRLGYWLFRNPLVMFGLGPIWSLVIQPRIVSRSMSKRLRRNRLVTTAVLVVLVGGVCWALGWQQFLLIQTPVVMLAGGAGVWLFYVQHQFEDVYWESAERWSYADAALQGSSYLKLPKVLQFFTGSIGLHHVHHLNARIPSYNLQRAHDENEVFADVPVLGIADGIRSVRLKLWDPERRRLITFAEARRARAPRAAPAAVRG